MTAAFVNQTGKKAAWNPRLRPTTPLRGLLINFSAALDDSGRSRGRGRFVFFPRKLVFGGSSKRGTGLPPPSVTYLLIRCPRWCTEGWSCVSYKNHTLCHTSFPDTCNNTKGRSKHQTWKDCRAKARRGFVSPAGHRTHS